MGKAKSFVPDEKQPKFRPDVEDDGPDVSGLNPKPVEPGVLERVLQAVGDPKTASGAAIQKGTHGASYGLSDEVGGLIGASDEASTAARQALGLEDKPEALADPLDGSAPPEKSILQRVAEAYRKNRNATRADLDAAQKAQPEISTVAELGGALLAPAPKAAPLAQGATRLQRMLAMAKAAAPVGAAFGAGNSEADLTQGDVGGFLKDTATGAALSAGTGAALGGILHGSLSKLEGKEREAIAKAQSMAAEALDKPQRQAQSALGGRIQSGHRDIEAATAGATDDLADPLLQRELGDLLNSPEGIALRNRVLEGKAKALPGKLGEIDEAQRVFDAAKAANTPEAVEREAARILGPERFKEATLMRLKKYAGRTLPPLIGSGIGSAIGGTEGAIGGALLGGMASSVLGSPGTALANYMRDPSVMLRLAQAGQSPTANQIPQKAVASLTSDEEQRRRLLSLLGGD